MSLGEQVVVIQPPKKWPKPNVRLLWASRDLAYFLGWRDVKIRYKQSFVGIGWALLQPLMFMIAFSFIFGQVADIPSEGLPYPVFVLAGLIPWTFFSSAVSFSSASLVGNMSLVTKVYFPRALLPISGVLTYLIDFGISFMLLLLTMALFGVAPPLVILLSPFIMIYVVLTALGIGLWLSAVNVKYRDVRHMLPFIIQLWLFLTPVIYPGSSLADAQGWLRVVYGLNPMVGAVETFRWATVGTPFPAPEFFLPSVAVVAALLVTGIFYFMKTEQTFADVI